MIFLKKIYSKLLGLLFITLDILVPKKNIIIFSGQLGKRYFDNTKYLFEYYLKEANPKQEIYWLYTEKSPELKCIPKQNLLSIYSIKGVKKALQARVAFCCYSTADFGLVRFSKRTIFVQIWHGIPIKTIFLGEQNLTFWKKLSYKLELNHYDYFIVSSPFEAKVIQQQTLLNRDKILQTGYPRNDELKRLINHKDIVNSERYILFAPTFRESGYSAFESLNQRSWQAIHDLLKQHNVKLIIRAHATEFIYHSSTAAKNVVTEFPQFIFANNIEYPDVQALMLKSSLLISDYSGIITDYLLMKKPIIRYMPDLLQYTNERGLIDYSPAFLGLPAHNADELLQALNEALTHPEKCTQALEVTRNIIHPGQEKSSCYQLYNKFL